MPRKPPSLSTACVVRPVPLWTMNAWTVPTGSPSRLSTFSVAATFAWISSWVGAALGHREFLFLLARSNRRTGRAVPRRQRVEAPRRFRIARRMRILVPARRRSSRSAACVAAGASRSAAAAAAPPVAPCPRRRPAPLATRLARLAGHAGHLDLSPRRARQRRAVRPRRRRRARRRCAAIAPRAGCICRAPATAATPLTVRTSSIDARAADAADRRHPALCRRRARRDRSAARRDRLQPRPLHVEQAGLAPLVVPRLGGGRARDRGLPRLIRGGRCSSIGS